MVWCGVARGAGEQYYESGLKGLGKSLNMPAIIANKDASMVPKAMVDALTSSAPKYRYRVGTDSKYVLPAVRWMHEKWQDTFVNMDTVYKVCVLKLQQPAAWTLPVVFSVAAGLRVPTVVPTCLKDYGAVRWCGDEPGSTVSHGITRHHTAHVANLDHG